MDLSLIKSNHNKPSVLRGCSPGNVLQQERWCVTSLLQEAASEAAPHDSRETGAAPPLTSCRGSVPGSESNKKYNQEVATIGR